MNDHTENGPPADGIARLAEEARRWQETTYARSVARAPGYDQPAFLVLASIGESFISPARAPRRSCPRPDWNAL